MLNSPTTLTFATPEKTCEFARRLAPYLAKGDALLLSGGIGAGKTHFARCLIQHLLTEPEDVPSPTFTLVQIYQSGRAEIWHSDLYRLNGPDEIIELGLVDAFESAICLVEWPDKLRDLRPEAALTLVFAPGLDETTRDVTLSWSTPRWTALLAKVIA